MKQVDCLCRFFYLFLWATRSRMHLLKLVGEWRSCRGGLAAADNWYQPRCNKVFFHCRRIFCSCWGFFCGNAGMSCKLLLLLKRPNFMKFIANFVDTFQHVSILLNSCPGKLSTRNPKLLFLFWSCRQSRHLPRWHLSCFCTSLRSPHFHKILNQKTGRWLFFWIGTQVFTDRDNP